MEYYLIGGYSGISSTNKYRDQWKKHNISEDGVQRVRMRCRKSGDSLSDFGERRIDMLSLDVEGHELRILQGIDWGKTSISMIVTEDSSLYTREFLHGKGFYKHNVSATVDGVGLIRNDVVYLHNTVKWGQPI